jgi:hypothetical protein
MIPLTAAPRDRIRPEHRDRLAVVYIRQSTPQQVERHQESGRLQYALVDHAIALGWPRERIRRGPGALGGISPGTPGLPAPRG